MLEGARGGDPPLRLGLEAAADKVLAGLGDVPPGADLGDLLKDPAQLLGRLVDGALGVARVALCEDLELVDGLGPLLAAEEVDGQDPDAPDVGGWAGPSLGVDYLPGGLLV